MNLEFMNLPPEDWETGQVARCPGCDCEMWVSKRKKDLQKEHANSKMICLECMVKAGDLLRKQGHGISLIDLSKGSLK